MKRLTNLLPALALVLGAFAAVAFSPKEMPMNQYGQSGSQWYNVTNVVPGPTTYTCDEAEEVHCLYDAVNGNPIEPLEEEIFVKRGPLTPA